MAVIIPIVTSWNGKGIKKAVKEFKSLEGVGAKLGFVLKNAALPAAAAFTAIAAAGVQVGQSLFGMARGAAEDQKGVKLLEAQIRQLTGASHEQAAAVEGIISKYQLATGVADDQLRPAFAQLVRASGSVSRANALMQAGLDISAGTGRDLGEVVMALSKAEMGNYKALKRLGIPMGKMTEAQAELANTTKLLTKWQEKYQEALDAGDTKKAEAALAKVNQLQADQNQLLSLGADYLKDVSAVFGGQAAVAADTFEGRLARLNVRISEAKESIGYKLLPYLEKMADVAIRVADAIGTRGLAGGVEEFKRQMSQMNYENSQVAAFFRKFYEGVRKVYNGLVDTFNIAKTLSGAGLLSNISGFLGGPEIPKFQKMPAWYDVFSALPNAPTVGAGRPSTSQNPWGSSSGWRGTTVNVNVNGGDPRAVVDALRTYSRTNGGITGVVIR